MLRYSQQKHTCVLDGFRNQDCLLTWKKTLENSDIFHMTMEKFRPWMKMHLHILSKMAIFHYHVSFRGSNIYQNKDYIHCWVCPKLLPKLLRLEISIQQYHHPTVPLPTGSRPWRRQKRYWRRRRVQQRWGCPWNRQQKPLKIGLLEGPPKKETRKYSKPSHFSGDMFVSAIFLLWRFEINVVLQRFWEKVPKSQGGNMGRGLQAGSGISSPWWGVRTPAPKTNMSHEKTLVVFGIHPGRLTWNLQTPI